MIVIGGVIIMNNNIFDDFIGLTSVSKTLRNELRPTEATRRHIEENGIIEDDELRNRNRKEIKSIMDDYYRAYIDNKLSMVDGIDWQHLFDMMLICKKNKKKNEALLEEQTSVRNVIYNYLSDNRIPKDFRKSELFTAKLITKLLPDFIRNNAEYKEDEKIEKMNAVYYFSKITTDAILSKLYVNRQFIFSNEAKAGTICNRIVHENADIHMQNLIAFDNIKNYAHDEISLMNTKFNKELGEWSFEQIYTPDFYSMVLTQKGIEFYNEMCGLVNLHMNLYCQQTKKKNLFKMNRLNKQILSESGSLFELDKYEDDNEVYNSINSFIANINEKKITERLAHIADSVEEYDLERVYITSKAYNDISKCMFGSDNWYVIRQCLEIYYGEHISKKAKNRDEKIREAIKKEKYRSINSIDLLIKQFYVQNANSKEYISVSEYIKHGRELLRSELRIIHRNEHVKLIEDKEKTEEIKNTLDYIKSVYDWTQLFITEDIFEIDYDVSFYAEIADIYNDLNEIIPLYNKVRNYITQKPYKREMIRLDFGHRKLADSWDEDKYFDANAILLMKDNRFYLAVFNAKNRPLGEMIKGNNLGCESDYMIMRYKQLTNINANMARIFGKPYANKDEYRKLIDYYKDCIDKKDDWKCYNFKFLATEDYNDINEFYNDIANQAYKISWNYISEKDINNMDRDGQIYLFQIYNKDFGSNSSGKENLHTLYLKNLFSKENMDNGIIKLNGNAELLCRKKGINKPIIHERESYLVNRTITYKDSFGNEIKQSIPDSIYTEIYNKLNGKCNTISKEAKEWMDSGNVKWHKATKAIIKDYRYTQDKYFLHISITINYKVNSSDKPKKIINNLALRHIAKDDNIHIIGIDRGERNLIYVSVIDSNGVIKEQKSFNISNGYDYKQKLKQREKERDEARESWQTIGKIRELKEGYLSTVIHEITNMMFKYNAIVVMEDLNRGFKKSRFFRERQVYQKFETMLINKLNYLVSKDRIVDDNGGILKGYQLAYIPENLKKLGKQCGVIFYVQASYTSKIDPVTGFIDAFDFKKITNSALKKSFLTKFEEIRYDKSQNMFRLSFDYDNFDIKNLTLAKTVWTVYSNDTRIKKKFENGHATGKSEEVNLTDEIINILNSSNIKYDDGHNLVHDIECIEENNKIISEIFYIFRLIVQMRNSLSESEEEVEDVRYDRLISPVINENDVFFDSSDYMDSKNRNVILPCDADANGAYCIALKGLYLVKKIKDKWNGDKFNDKDLFISDKEWFDFIQNKRYL